MERLYFRSLLSNGKWCEDHRGFSIAAAEKVDDETKLVEEEDEAVTIAPDLETESVEDLDDMGTIAPVSESFSEPRVNEHTGNQSAKFIRIAPTTVGKISLPACTFWKEKVCRHTEPTGPERDQIPPQQVVKDANRNNTAAKADDAAVPVHIW